jgi:hypothetical protein
VSCSGGGLAIAGQAKVLLKAVFLQHNVAVSKGGAVAMADAAQVCSNLWRLRNRTTGHHHNNERLH